MIPSLLLHLLHKAVGSPLAANFLPVVSGILFSAHGPCVSQSVTPLHAINIKIHQSILSALHARSITLEADSAPPPPEPPAHARQFDKDDNGQNFDDETISL
ncbi:hypothetical protein FPQ18DRAFT_112145 [Pyronema domesticum]|nr:hypothetical protein FPQ18DRAFT_112145 [Pyronema domesticum]